jgi:hypothetical protein
MKKKIDLNQLAKSIVEQVTEEVVPKTTDYAIKGRAGGLSRMKGLSSDEKADLGRLAVSTRWGKTNQK